MTRFNPFSKFTKPKHPDTHAQPEQTPDAERLDIIYSYIPVESRKTIRIMSESRNGSQYTMAEITQIASIKEALLNALAKGGETVTATEINALFKYLLGETKKEMFDEAKFEDFKAILGDSYLSEIDRLKQGVRQGGRTTPLDYTQIRHLKEDILAGVIEKKLPFTPEEIDQYIDMMLVVSPETETETVPKPTLHYTDSISPEGMDTIAGADFDQIIRPPRVRTQPPGVGMRRPNADLEPLDEADLQAIDRVLKAEVSED